MMNVDYEDVMTDTKCPKCGSYSITGEYPEIEANGAQQTAYCMSCGANWVAHYSLVKIEIIDEQD